MTPEIARAVELARFIVQLDEQFREAFHNGNPDATTLATALLALASQLPTPEECVALSLLLSALRGTLDAYSIKERKAAEAALDRLLAGTAK